jgi:ribonuclease HII
VKNGTDFLLTACIDVVVIAIVIGVKKDIPDFELEIASGADFVAGVDEAGRGPLCGPVVAAAVIFPNREIEIPVVIRDSKQMTARQRAAAFDWIINNTVWAVAECSPAEIDEMNILWASMLAMRRAVAKLNVQPQHCLIDGNRVPDEINGTPVVHGDAKSLSIAAASIIAKETRDKIMNDLAKQFPQYGWDKNAGYPTKSHLQAIELYGINQHYRKSYGPVKERMKNENSHN